MEVHDSFCTSSKAIVIIEAFDLNSPDSEITFKVVVSTKVCVQLYLYFNSRILIETCFPKLVLRAAILLRDKSLHS